MINEPSTSKIPTLSQPGQSAKLPEVMYFKRTTHMLSTVAHGEIFRREITCVRYIVHLLFHLTHKSGTEYEQAGDQTSRPKALNSREKDPHHYIWSLNVSKYS